MRSIKKPTNDQASTPASQHGTRSSASYQKSTVAKPLENRSRAPATSAVTLAPEKGKQKASTASHENETTNPNKSQDSIKYGTLNATFISGSFYNYTRLAICILKGICDFVSTTPEHSSDLKIGQHVTQMVYGGLPSFAIDGKDNVWEWGLNSFGKAGDVKTTRGNFTVLPCPMMIPRLCGRGIMTIAGGVHRSAVVMADSECLSGVASMEDSSASNFQHSNFEASRSSIKTSIADHASGFDLLQFRTSVGSTTSLLEQSMQLSSMRKDTNMPLSLAHLGSSASVLRQINVFGGDYAERR
ncbi:hypothetical protein GGI35DRAFT_476152 [Trichoderma velutinum]